MKYALYTLVALLIHVPFTSANETAADWLAHNLYAAMLNDEFERVASAYSSTPNINTPHGGAAEGKEAVIALLKEERKWLVDLGVDKQSLRPIKTTRNDDRVIHEFTMALENSTPPFIHKFAVVVDTDDELASAVRIYYGSTRIRGVMDFSRPSMLPHDPSLLDGIAPPVKQYIASIGNAYPGSAGLFTEDACFNDSCALNRHKHFIIMMMGGNIPLKLATATCDEVTCALEENLGAWGDTVFSSNTAGLAVYDYNDSGKLTAARIYDDISENPFTSFWFVENWAELRKRFAEIGCPLGPPPKVSDPFPAIFFRIMSQECAAP